MEALGLGLFMIVASVCGTILEFPESAIHRALPNAALRRSIMGVVIGLTAIGLAHSPWGRRSGAHLNPAMTWTFFRLDRVRASVALLYTLAQFSGGLVGCLVVAGVAGHAFLAPPVEGIATVLRSQGVAFVAELAISGLLMLVVQ